MKTKAELAQHIRTNAKVRCDMSINFDLIIAYEKSRPVTKTSPVEPSERMLRAIAEARKEVNDSIRFRLGDLTDAEVEAVRRKLGYAE
jgi:lysophospholipase L1-like esterase